MKKKEEKQHQMRAGNNFWLFPFAQENVLKDSLGNCTEITTREGIFLVGSERQRRHFLPFIFQCFLNFVSRSVSKAFWCTRQQRRALVLKLVADTSNLKTNPGKSFSTENFDQKRLRNTV